MNNFTPRSKQVLALAQQEARRLNHDYVGPEHLLLGLLMLGQGVAVSVLKSMGLSIEKLRLEAEKFLHLRLQPKCRAVYHIPVV